MQLRIIIFLFFKDPLGSGPTGSGISATATAALETSTRLDLSNLDPVVWDLLSAGLATKEFTAQEHDDI